MAARRTASAGQIARRSVLLAAIAGPLSRPSLGGDGGGQHTGSAQPYQGFFKLSPIVLRNGPHTLLVDSAVRFHDRHKNLISAPKGDHGGGAPEAHKSGDGVPLDTDAQKLVNYRIYNGVLMLWYGRGSNINREDVAEVIKETIDDVTRVEAVEQVVFLKFSAR